jgi:hypothetical protein
MLSFIIYLLVSGICSSTFGFTELIRQGTYLLEVFLNACFGDRSHEYRPTGFELGRCERRDEVRNYCRD